MGEALNELADPDYARECGENGRQAVERQYNWAHDGSRLRAIYHEL